MPDPHPFTPRYRPDRLEPGAVLSRYAILPGDPPVLARWLAVQAVAHGDGYPEDWPAEPGR